MGASEVEAMAKDEMKERVKWGIERLEQGDIPPVLDLLERWLAGEWDNETSETPDAL